MTSHRGTFRPELIPAAIPASQRGHFEIAPEPARPGQFRLWLYGDGNQSKRATILLTIRDVRGLSMWFRQLAETPEGQQQSRPAAKPQTKPPTEPAGQPQARWRPGGPSPPQRPGPA
jgi:hypothetical protein